MVCETISWENKVSNTYFYKKTLKSVKFFNFHFFYILGQFPYSI